MAEVLQLDANGWMPNNPHLPVLLYRQRRPDRGRRSGGGFEDLFERNGWPAQWRNGVYPFHHYHSNAHEVLGFARRPRAPRARRPGRSRGRRSEPAMSPCLPAGTGHFRQEATRDFLVVGAYPPDQSADLCRSAPTPEMLARIARVPFPATDPVRGTSGP